jgi:kynurenine formamidase
MASTDSPLQAYNFHDLSHIVPFFHPLHGDNTKSDLSKPSGNSKPVAGSGEMLGTRTIKPPFQTKTGMVKWGHLYMEEHYSTHVDSTDHYITTDESLITHHPQDHRSAEEFTLEELIGPMVYIDISERVKKELAKNGGKPSIDTSITNFDNDSGNNIGIDEINAIADQIVDGAYLVFNLGWEQNYVHPPLKSNWEHPYNNNMNHPGITPAAVDRLIEIENERGIRIAGIAADNIGVESGHSIRGDMPTDRLNPREFVMYMHAVGLHRGWKIIENAANLSALSPYKNGDCTLIVGAPKMAGSSGSPARLIAMCKK